MEFRVLGPVESRVAGRVVDLGTAKQQCVLAALLWSAGRPVPVELLIERVWGDQPPNQARSSVYSYIARLRRVIERAESDRPVRLIKSGHGYQLQVRPEQVDLSRYRELTSRSRRIDLTREQRGALLRDAIALWRGDPLSGIQGDWASRVRDSLISEHLGVLAEWAGAELALSRSGVVIERLSHVPGIRSTKR
jgi:DNA-binding SARP family transcriptional activator